MNANLYNTTDYERKRDWTLGENKPNSNPNKPNLRKAKMNVNLTLTKDYRKKDDFLVQINKPNLVRRRRIAKMNVNAFLQKDYENEPPSDPRKNKPNSNPISNAGKRTKEAKKKKRVPGTSSRLWIAGKIDFLDGCDILYLWEISI